MKVGILTSGGDCPGLNAVIRGIVLKGERSHGTKFIGYRDGWHGVLNNDTISLSLPQVRGISKLGGTILGTSRSNPFERGDGLEIVQQRMDSHGLEAIITIGGEGTLAVSKRLADAGINIVGVPKTIDNDLGGTDYTFGFDTAVQTATDALDRLRTTGESHHRCMIAEVMGRHAGWIALHSGMSAGAHAVLIPEVRTPMKTVYAWISSARNRGRAPLVVVAEGFIPEDRNRAFSYRGVDAFGRPRLGGIAEELAPIIEKETGIETRATSLGHILRGGTPTATDRILATRLGMAAIDAVVAKRWGYMVALHSTEINYVQLGEALGKLKTVPLPRYEEAAVLFG